MEKSIIGIYKITNIKNKKVYIGQSVNIKKRWTKHKNTYYNPKYQNYNSPLYRAMRAYGIEFFIFEIIEECLKDELNEKEVFYISQYKSNNPDFGYNLSDGGTFVTGHKLNTDRVKSILSELRLNQKSTNEIAMEYGVTSKMISDINRGFAWHQDNESYPARTRKVEIAICKKEASIRKAHYDKAKCEFEKLGKIAVACMIKEIGICEVGQRFCLCEDHVRKLCASIGLPKNKSEIVEWYNLQLGIVPTPKPKKPTRIRAVKQIDIDTGEVINVFKSIAEASIGLGKDYAPHIANVCNGRRKAAYGYRWEFV